MNVQEYWSYFTSQLDVERLFKDAYDPEVTAARFQQHNNIPLFFLIFYLVVLHFGEKFMRQRKEFNIDWILLGWNGAMMFLFGFTGTNLFRHISSTHDVSSGYLNFYCDKSWTSSNVSIYVLIFVLSKFLLLCDSVFLLLRRKPVHFFHVFHHVMSLVYSYHSYSILAPELCILALISNVESFVMHTSFLLSTICQMLYKLNQDKSPLSLDMTHLLDSPMNSPYSGTNSPNMRRKSKRFDFDSPVVSTRMSISSSAFGSSASPRDFPLSACDASDVTSDKSNLIFSNYLSRLIMKCLSISSLFQILFMGLSACVVVLDIAFTRYYSLHQVLGLSLYLTLFIVMIISQVRSIKAADSSMNGNSTRRGSCMY